jgi:hypothetical protein
MDFLDMIKDQWYIAVGIGVLLFGFFIISEISHRAQKKKTLESNQNTSGQEEK